MFNDQHLLIRGVSKALLPILALVSFYFLFQVANGPGAGIVGGIFLAFVNILYALIFGLAASMRAFTPGFARLVAALGLILACGLSAAPMFLGQNALELWALFAFMGPSLAHLRDTMANLGLEFAIFCTVWGSVLTLFYALAGRVSAFAGGE